MINVISQQNIENINLYAEKLFSLIKETKFYFTSEYNADSKIKNSDSLLEIYRGLSADYRFYSITSDSPDALINLEKLVNRLSSLLDSKPNFMSRSVKDYCADIKPKLCRELITDLDYLLIAGEINRDDINDVYVTLNKPVPKKYTSGDLVKESLTIYTAISEAIKDKSLSIKANSILHYQEMVKKIAPLEENISKKEFIRIGKRQVSDISALRICVACKYSNDLFHDLINESFETLLNVASSKIYNHFPELTNESKVKVLDVKLGGKGFDLVVTVNSKTVTARAIPVEGYFVRFHYRYIIT